MCVFKEVVCFGNCKSIGVRLDEVVLKGALAIVNVKALGTNVL